MMVELNKINLRDRMSIHKPFMSGQQGFVLLSTLVLVMIISGMMIWFYEKESFALAYLRSSVWVQQFYAN